MNLSDRINAVYLTHTGRDKPRGAKAWFARTLRVSTRGTVTRWCKGTEPFDGSALACLELLELLAKTIRGHVAMAAGYRADTVGDQWERDNWLALADSLRVTQGP